MGFWKIYFVVLLGAALANWGYEAVRHPGLLLAQWPLLLMALCLVGLNLLGLYGFIRHRPFMGAGFWQLLLAAQGALYLFLAAQVAGDLITDPRTREAATRMPLFLPFVLAGLLLPLPQFVALFRYSRQREIWGGE